MPPTKEMRIPLDLVNMISDRELIAPADPRSDFISINSDRMSGAPCFVGTRVPRKHLFDYLEAGESLDDFLEGFEGVTRTQAIGVLELAFTDFTPMR